MCLLSIDYVFFFSYYRLNTITELTIFEYTANYQLILLPTFFNHLFKKPLKTKGFLLYLNKVLRICAIF
jgi:hypothetical protein